MEFAEIYLTPAEVNLFNDPKNIHSFVARCPIDTVQFLYGWMFRNGIHFPKNLPEAYEYFRVSAKNGNIRGIQALLSLHVDLLKSQPKPHNLAQDEELKNYFPILEREFLKKNEFYLSYLCSYTACLYFGRGCAVNQRKACLLLIEAILGMASITRCTKKIVNVLHGIIYKNNPELRSLIDNLFTKKPELKILINTPAISEERITALMREAFLPTIKAALSAMPAQKTTQTIPPAQDAKRISEIEVLNTHLTNLEQLKKNSTLCIQKHFQSFTRELSLIGSQLEKVGQLLNQVETLSKQTRHALSVKLESGISTSASSSSSATLSMRSKSNGLEDLLMAINSEVEFEIEDPSSDVEIIESPKNKGTKRKAGQNDANTEPAKRRKP